MNPCTDFRARLENALLGRPDPARARELAWHEHLNGCGSCRALLAAEEALEDLLATLPEPRLEAGLAQRVLARLSAEGEATLDGLLELDRITSTQGLSERVLSGLGEERARLDELRRLDALLGRVPSTSVPAGLAKRTLEGLERHRVPAPKFALLRGRGVRITVAAAAVIAIVLFVWKGTGHEPGAPRENGAGPVVVDTHGTNTEPRPSDPGKIDPQPADQPDEELLAALDVLEEWDLLLDEDLDVLLSALDPVEEELLDLAYDEEEGG